MSSYAGERLLCVLLLQHRQGCSFVFGGWSGQGGCGRGWGIVMAPIILINSVFFRWAATW